MLDNYTHVEFLKTRTAGPYGVPLRIVEAKEDRVLLEIEIDGIFHSFPIRNSSIISVTPEPIDTSLAYVEITENEMADFFRKISAVVKSERNAFAI